MKHQNLQPKCIMDFTNEDTIYITIPEGRDNDITFLCKFKEYKGNKVTGIVIEATKNPKMYSRDIENAREVSARIEKCGLYGENPVSKRTHYHWFKSTGYAIYPMEYNKESDNADIIKEHPSFGLIGLSRRSSNGTALFGSSIKHSELISLTIRRGEVNRDLNREWYHGKEELIEIEMSANQFAEFITTPNVGSGVPCTIKHVGRTRMPDPIYEDKKTLFSKEFENKMKNISSGLEGNLEILKNILSKKSIGKGDKQEIENLFTKFKSDISSSVPFIESSFVEQMDKTVTEAKSEIEAFVNRRITEEGKKVLLGETGDSAILIDGNKE